MEKPSITLVLMAGLPGAGKTTLATALGIALDWTVIDKDKIKQEFTEKRYNNEEAGKKAYATSFTIARKILINNQKSVILDSAAIHPFILNEAEKIVSSATNIRLKVILCVIDRYERHYRLRNRPYQAATVPADPETTSGYLALFEHLPPGNTLTIYTNDLLKECLKKAISYLRNTQPYTEQSYEPEYKFPDD